MRECTRKAFGVVSLTGALIMVATPAAADHSHVAMTGNGNCVVLAAGAGESRVVLKDPVFERNPNVTLSVDPASPDFAPIAKRHPLHVLVHKGSAGTHRALYVSGSTEATAACAGLLNK
jgi:hypothetical protein